MGACPGGEAVKPWAMSIISLSASDKPEESWASRNLIKGLVNGITPSKYDDQILLRETRSSIERICSMCGRVIQPGEAHYREGLVDPRINFIGKRLCAKCYADGKDSKGPLDRF